MGGSFVPTILQKGPSCKRSAGGAATAGLAVPGAAVARMTQRNGMKADGLKNDATICICDTDQGR